MDQLTRAVWRKAAKSGGNGGNCVEVARNLPGVIAVRDSKHPDGPALLLTPADWQNFTNNIKAGAYDLT